jgi:DNA repair exonuclease SbcCD ATPase subunit
LEFDCDAVGDEVMLHHIRISNWKKHEEFELPFEKGVNFITGPNGIGKTSILDAICYAFLGTLEFVGSYHGIKPADLIRNPENDSEICVTFSAQEGKRYDVIRRITPSRRATLKSDGETIATGWQGVTSKILELFKASDVFLGRYVFLTEGETYEYINKPPGEGLAKHIESVLGIESMENFENVFGALYKKYTDVARDLRKQVTGAQIATDEDRALYTELDKQLQGFLDEQKRNSDDIEKLNKEHGASSSEVESLKKAQVQIGEILDDWQKYFAPLDLIKDPIQVIKKKRMQLENEYKDLMMNRNKLSTESGRLSALIDSAKSVIELLQSLPDKDADRVCPVCKRPLTAHMVEQIEKESLETVERLETNLANQKTQIVNTENAIEDNRKKLSTLDALESRVTNVLKYGPATLSTTELQEKITSLEKKAESLTQQADQLKKNRDALETQVGELRSKIDRIREKIEPMKINTLNSSLISATKIEFLSQVFLNSVEDSLSKQRNIMLAPLMKELSTMWSQFMNTSVEVEMGDKCELSIIDKRYHAPFKFPQLSGGEKTALLILTHMLLCKHFSDSDFMLLDEPLEHLDARNRWALVNFLIQSCKRGAPEQLVVTTIEEPYIREYMEDPLVKVTRLG